MGVDGNINNNNNNYSNEMKTEEQKQEWARQMRLLFTPKDMLNQDGTLNEEYFKPVAPQNISVRKWGTDDAEALLKGIEEFGVGNWAPIKEKYLPKWEKKKKKKKISQKGKKKKKKKKKS